MSSAPVSNANSRVLKFSTSIPFDAIELGKAMIEIYTLDIENKRSLLTKFEAASTEMSSSDLAPVSAAIANTWPAIKRRPTDWATGITQFSIGVKSSVSRLVIRVIDPLGRMAEAGE